jgi:hypothetical protein
LYPTSRSPRTSPARACTAKGAKSRLMRVANLIRCDFRPRPGCLLVVQRRCAARSLQPRTTIQHTVNNIAHIFVKLHLFFIYYTRAPGDSRGPRATRTGHKRRGNIFDKNDNHPKKNLGARKADEIAFTRRSQLFTSRDAWGSVHAAVDKIQAGEGGDRYDKRCEGAPPAGGVRG